MVSRSSDLSCLLTLHWILLISLVILAGGCRFGPAASCTYPCHCEGGEACDPDTGDCPKGCDTNNQNDVLYSGDWSGPGCQIGNMAYGMNAENLPETYNHPDHGRIWVGVLAVDGNIDPNMDNGHCAHSQAPSDDPIAAWEVTFDQDVVLSSVTVYNRNSNRRRLKYTVFEVANNMGSYTECGRTAFDLHPNMDIIIVTCDEPLRGTKLRLRRLSSGLDSRNMNICEVFAIGYIYEDCEDGVFGPGCLTSCNCQDSCDDLSGNCPTNCIAGKTGDACQQNCSDRKWGINCANDCRCSDSMEICDKVTGSCRSGCPSNIVGIGCNRDLPSLQYAPPPVMVGSTATSVTVMFDATRVKNETSGYLLQYQSAGSSTWQNGTRIPVEDGLSSYNISTGNLLPKMPYMIRVVPLIDHDGITSLGQSGIAASAYTQVETGGGQNSIGVVTGVVLGVLIAIVIIIMVVIMLRRRRQVAKKKRHEPIITAGISNEAALDENAYDHAAMGLDIYVNVKPSDVTSTARLKPPTAAASDVAKVTPNGRASGDAQAPLVSTTVGLATTTRSAGDAAGDDTEDELDELAYEPIYDRPHPVSRPIKVADLADCIKTAKTSLNGFETEYESLPALQTAPWEASLLPQNVEKNRFRNIRTYDHSRVKLAAGEDSKDASIHYNMEAADSSDYINASYIHGYNDVPQAYIASQAPTANSVQDFWEMIWQENVNRVIMVTNLIEAGRVKCEQYWPPPNGSLILGEFTVRTVNTEMYADYTMRQLALTYKGKARAIHQFHFTGWPDHGVPIMAASLLEFRRKIRSHDKIGTGPMLVHCSAGIGRTGTFIAIDHQLEQAKAEGQVDVKSCVLKMRKNRIKMVQNIDQYVFVYDALLEALLCGDTTVPANEMAQRYQQLLSLDAKRNRSELELQFELLHSASPAITTDTAALTGLDPANRNKNRTMDIIPANHVRPYLNTKVEGSTDYINAAYVGGHRRRNAYLTTQMPLPETVCDIWRLLHDHRSSTIIMLNEHDEHDKMAAVYWPEDVSASLTFSPLTITTVDKNEGQHANIKVRDLHVTNQAKDIQKPTIVKQFCLSGWPDVEDVPSSTEDVLALIDMTERWQQQSGNGPITIQCRDGVHHSGLFVAACYLLDKLKIDQEVDVFQVVKQIRLARPQFIPTLLGRSQSAQYQYLHELAIAYMATNETYANFR